MNDTSRRAEAGRPDRAKRLQSRIAALLTVLLHLLLLLLVLLSPPITMTVPQGSDAGSALQVTYVDDSLQPPPPVRPPAPRKAPPRPPAKTRPKATRVQTTLVVQAKQPVPPDETETSDSSATAPAVEAVQPPSVPTAPPDTPADVAQPQAQTPVASPPTPTPRPNRTWGQPPGMQQDNPAPVNAGLARSSGVSRGRGNSTSAGPDLEVDGYQVYYDLISENRLRAWREQGITELFLPLPGTRRYMVCPLEVALRRGSGACRMVAPDAPELKTIGDARQVINMQRVYKLGDEVWSGPGPYR